MAAEMLGLRKQELKRRIDNLPLEVKAWKDATESEVDKNAHFSQLRAIEVLVNTFVKQQQMMLGNLEPAGDAEAFNVGCLNLIKNVIRSHKTWDFFRDKLALRHSPSHKEPLWVADTIAWDCHRPVMNQAVQFGIVNANQLREPPLIYCTADYSPATWVRGSRPNDGRAYDLGETLLPIPVIEMPWDHVTNAWEYLALHHEVGHDIESDLKLRPVLQNSLQQVLSGASVPLSRIKVWLKWEAEVFADLCGLQLAGPAFTEALINLLLLPAANVKTFDEDDPHPTHYTRILMNAEYIRTLGNAQAIKDHAAQLETKWKSVYGVDSGDTDLDAMTQDFPLVFQSLMDTKFPILKDHTVRELMPFTDVDDAKIRFAEKFFLKGTNRPNDLPLRHTVSAARFAIATASQDGSLSDQLCSDIHQRVCAYVRETAPQGLRGGGPDEHEKFIASFTERMFPE
jgi:hypothetical protein